MIFSNNKDINNRSHNLLDNYYTILQAFMLSVLHTLMNIVFTILNMVGI